MPAVVPSVSSINNNSTSSSSSSGKGQKPTKGVRPKFDGIPGQLMQPSEVPTGLLFGAKVHASPYDAKLRELAVAPSGAALQFAGLRARPSLYSRARKLNLKVEFAELGGKLYVRIAPMTCSPSSTTAAGGPPPPSLQQELISEKRIRNHTAILAAVCAGKRTPEAIAAAIRAEIPHADGVIVRSMLKQMQQAGSVRLTKISPETWEPVEKG